MKNRNPYLSLIILWIIVVLTQSVGCVFSVFVGNKFLIFWCFALIVIDSIFLGFHICKFNAYREFLNYMKEMQEKAKSVGSLCAKAEDEPFKEFENNGK